MTSDAGIEARVALGGAAGSDAVGPTTSATCVVEGCPSKSFIRGLCRRCYDAERNARLRRGGSDALTRTQRTARGLDNDPVARRPPRVPKPRVVKALPIVAEELPPPLVHVRPKTRGDCIDAPRPCPYVGCRHHVASEVLAGGTLRIIDDLEALADTCSLDVADRGPASLLEIGEIFGLSRERVRQIEADAMESIRRQQRRTKGALAELAASIDERTPSAWDEIIGRGEG